MSAALALPDRLDRDAARDLHAELLQRRGTDLDLDGSDVRAAGALAVQVLVAASRDWAATGRTLTLSASLPMREDLIRLGVLTEFRLQEVT
ncbi:MAG: STAS domain-containing protein [Acetobacteraceae bacterium]|nr:MAG: STAS domain-containing protein [Acetobacteraceae bacterium]